MAEVEPERATAHITRALKILRDLEAQGRLAPDKAGGIAVLEAMLGGR